MCETLLENTALLTFLGAVVGGFCAFIGGIVGVKIQLSMQKKTNKRKILLQYYDDLGLLYLYISDVHSRTVIDIGKVKKKIDEYKAKFFVNGQFSYFIEKKWLKDEHIDFVKNMEKTLEDQNSSLKEILENLLASISNEMDSAMKKM